MIEVLDQEYVDLQKVKTNQPLPLRESQIEFGSGKSTLLRRRKSMDAEMHENSQTTALRPYN